MKRFFKKRRGKKGFTLVELLVSMVITTIIAISAFSILISSMNTFKKEGDITDAMATKDMVMSFVKSSLNKRESVLLADTNTSWVQLDAKTDDEIALEKTSQVTVYKSEGYIIDEKMKTHHLMYCRDGRIYTVTSNEEGRYDISTDPTVANYPLKLVPGEPYDHYCFDLFDETVYGDYNIDIEFKPLLDQHPLGTPPKGETVLPPKYHSLQVFVYVRDPKKNNVIVVQGSETFPMLNIVVQEKEIRFSEHSNNGRYNFCYFS